MTQPFPWQAKRQAQYLAETPDFNRILAIPRRVWTDDQLRALALGLTAQLRTINGTAVLKPAQALALHDIVKYRGAFCPIKVGGGKTLVTLLAPYVLQSRKPLLLLPAGLIGKTQRELKETYLPHWRIPRNIEMYSYEMLARVESADKLTKDRPDLIIMDEGHKVKNLHAGVTKRLRRYMHDHPQTVVVILGGTLITHSIRDFAHSLGWALKDHAPVPYNQGEIEELADALDRKVPDQKRLEPGPWLKLATMEDQSEDDLTTARKGFRRRLIETGGIVCTSGETVDASLYIRDVPLQVSAKAEEYYQTLRQKWVRPDGWAFDDAMSVWNCARELALGFCSVWDPHPPQDWLNARYDWAKFVRETLAHSHTLDTPEQVKQAVLAGDQDDGGALRAWEDMYPTFVPNMQTLWHDDVALDLCATWGHKEKGIIWTHRSAFGRKLAQRTGFPYYGREGMTDDGKYIENGQGPVIASIAANSTGRNLQMKWHKNLMTSCPSTAAAVEQWIGRTHRTGQEADTVTVDVLLGCREHWDAMDGARAQAAAERDLMPGSDQHKLLISDITWPGEQAILARPGFAWQRTKDVREERDKNPIDWRLKLEEMDLDGDTDG